MDNDIPIDENKRLDTVKKNRTKERLNLQVLKFIKKKIGMYERSYVIDSTLTLQDRRVQRFDISKKKKISCWWRTQKLTSGELRILYRVGFWDGYKEDINITEIIKTIKDS